MEEVTVSQIGISVGVIMLAIEVLLDKSYIHDKPTLVEVLLALLNHAEEKSC